MSEAGLVQRTIWVLRAVAAHPDGIGLSEVARESGIPKATCYRVLSTLERERWVSCDTTTRQYRISLGLVSVVGGLLDQTTGYMHTREALEQLAKETEETAGFDVLIPPEVMVLAQAQGPFLIGQTLKPVPRTQPVWHTSSGKALLSCLEPDDVREQFGDTYDEQAQRTHGSLDDYLEMLGRIREEGYAYAFDELEPGAASVGAPVRLRNGPNYALWIGGPTYRLTRERIAELGGVVRAAADRLADVLDLSGSTEPIR